jgi:hypothetical protein
MFLESRMTREFTTQHAKEKTAEGRLLKTLLDSSVSIAERLS